jgi:hypothetical protein
MMTWPRAIRASLLNRLSNKIGHPKMIHSQVA